MRTNFKKVSEFHRAFDLPCNDTLNQTELTNFSTCALRIKLINEELTELDRAKNLIDELDAVADLLYVIYGTGVSFGINLDIAYSFYLNKLYQVPINNSITNFQKTEKCKSPTQLPNALFNIALSLKEMSFNILINDTQSIARNLSEMLFHLYNLCHYHYRINADKLFNIIHISNMSKLCATEQNACLTVNWYLEYEKERYPKPTYKKADGQDYWIVFDSSTGKILKSRNFIEPKIIAKELLLSCK